MRNIYVSSMRKKAMKRKIKITVHYTASPNAVGTIEYLDKRLGGKGTVGYNFLISKDAVYELGNHQMWFHNTGKGTEYDSNTYSIAFVGYGLEDITDEMIREAMLKIRWMNAVYDVTDILCHREVNPKKPDFSEEEWAILLPKLKGE